MAYNPSTPLNSSEDPSTTEPKLRENFQKLESYLAKNHVDIETETTASPDQGKHKFLQMPEQTSAPTTAANEIALYSKEASGVSALFYRKEGDGTEVQLTGNSTDSTIGEVFIGGIIMKWGTILALPNGAETPVVFVTPFSTSIFNISVSAVQGSSGARALAIRNGTIQTTGFSIKSQAGPVSFYWTAIGV